MGPRLADVRELGAARLQPGERGRHVVDVSGHERAHLRTAVQHLHAVRAAVSPKQAVFVAYETGLIGSGGDAPARP